PVTFMNKYCPEQFEILGLGNGRENFTPNKDYLNPKMVKKGKESNGNAINRVLTIEQDNEPKNTVYYTSDNSKYLIAPYARIIIRKK
ncbi:MAG: adenine-specific methyltransferase EcoRI family protein, partial [Bacteroidota bacterium]|nr:adenine-specific methyltransferase EcoRI family protein [Bacteroidota bacterium]